MTDETTSLSGSLGAWILEATSAAVIHRTRSSMQLVSAVVFTAALTLAPQQSCATPFLIGEFSTTSASQPAVAVEIADAEAMVPDKLASIRAALSLNVSEMARVLDIGRPALYAWMRNEASPRAANRSRLDSLYALAVEWSSRRPEPLGSQLREAGSDGVALLALLEAGFFAKAKDQLRGLADRTPPLRNRRVVSVREARRRSGLEGRSSGLDEIDRMTR